MKIPIINKLTRLDRYITYHSKESFNPYLPNEDPTLSNFKNPTAGTNAASSPE